MPISDMARKQFTEKIVTFKSLALTNVSATVPQTIAVYTLPRNYKLKNAAAGYITGDAAGTAVKAVITDSAGNVLLTGTLSTTGTGPGLPVFNTVNSDVLLTKDSTLLIKVLAANATDDFAGGVDVEVVFEHPKTDD